MKEELKKKKAMDRFPLQNGGNFPTMDGLGKNLMNIDDDVKKLWFTLRTMQMEKQNAVLQDPESSYSVLFDNGFQASWSEEKLEFRGKC